MSDNDVTPGPFGLVILVLLAIAFIGILLMLGGE